MSLVIHKEYPFSKVGIREIKGLESVLRELAAPLLAEIKQGVYWDENLSFEVNEYTSRDGFIPYSDNCGGLELSVIIPSCESYNFGYLEFGECDPEFCDCHTPEHANGSGECSLDIDGHKDAKLRVWLKFEGIDSDGTLNFWFYLGGGNGDAPYFRTRSEATVFEESFSVKSLAGLKRKGQSVIKRMIKVVKS
jgi:hypothetical protein